MSKYDIDRANALTVQDIARGVALVERLEDGWNSELLNAIVRAFQSAASHTIYVEKMSGDLRGISL